MNISGRVLTSCICTHITARNHKVFWPPCNKQSRSFLQPKSLPESMPMIVSITSLALEEIQRRARNRKKLACSAQSFNETPYDARILKCRVDRILSWQLRHGSPVAELESASNVPAGALAGMRGKYQSHARSGAAHLESLTNSGRTDIEVRTQPRSLRPQTVC